MQRPVDANQRQSGDTRLHTVSVPGAVATGSVISVALCVLCGELADHPGLLISYTKLSTIPRGTIFSRRPTLTPPILSNAFCDRKFVTPITNTTRSTNLKA